MRRLGWVGGLVVVIAGCGRTSLPLPLPPSVPVQSLRVTPIVPGMSDKWNVYVRYSGGPLAAVDGSACAASPTYRDCIHAGGLRRLDLDDVTACAGVTAQDSLSALVWSCVETGNGISLISVGVEPGMGLRDLIDFAGVQLRPMHLTVTTPVGDRVTDDAVWWSNPVAVAPADTGTRGAALDAVDTIYIVPENRSSAGLDITADGAALVTAADVQLTPIAGDQQCATLNVGVNTNSPAQCLVFASGAERLWLEVDLWGNPLLATVLLGMNGVVLPRLHGVHLHPSLAALQLVDVRGGRITNLTSDSNGSLVFQKLHGCLARDLRLAGSEAYFFDNSDNVFENLTTFGYFAGLNVQGDNSNNAFVRPLSFAHGGFGIQMVASGNTGNVFVGYTFADVANEAAGVFAAQRNTFALGVLANSAQQGLDVTDIEQTFTDLVSGMNAFSGVELESASGYGRFNGQLRVGGNGLGTCAVNAAATEPGLVADTCAAADASALSSVQVDLASLSDSFVGLVTKADAVNRSALGGLAAFPADPMAFDYSGAENRYRGWTVGGSSSFLDSSTRNCPAVGVACFTGAGAALQLVDWRLRAGDTLLRNTSLSADGNGSFIDGAACPSGLSDSVALDAHDGEVIGDGIGNDDGICEGAEPCAGNVYLVAAIEVIDDYAGDDDGLCESDEACVYAPNFGAYQGEGDYLPHTCVFADDVIHGVTMYGYPLNGFVGTP